MKINTNRVVSNTIVLLTFLISSQVFGLKKTKWQFIKKEKGIEVHKRTVKGTDIIELRGRGVIQGNIVEVLAILADNTRIQEWTASKKFFTIKKISETENLYYNLVGTPWPLQNRDYIGYSKFIVNNKSHWLMIRSKGVKNKDYPPKSGVVRMSLVNIGWNFKPISKNKIWIEYLTLADPGGMIPSWVVNWAAKKIPYDTLIKLRYRVKKKMYNQSFYNKYKKYETWGLKTSTKSSAPTSAVAKKKKKKKHSKKKK